MTHPSAEDYAATNLVLAEFASSVGGQFFESPEFQGTRFYGRVTGTRNGQAFDVHGWQQGNSIKPGERPRSKKLKLFDVLEYRVELSGAARSMKLKGRMMPNTSVDEKRWKKVMGKKWPEPDTGTREDVLNFLSLCHTQKIEDGSLMVIAYADELRPPDCTVGPMTLFLDNAIECAKAMDRVASQVAVG